MNKIDQIILVDHNSKNTGALQKDLSDSGFADHIKIAVNGEHALLCLDHLDLYKRIKGKKTMIILSVDTPVVNGISFLEAFRHKKYSTEEVFIAVTDNTSRENIEKAFSLGVTHVLSSPLKISEIMEAGINHFSSKKNRDRMARNRKPQTHQQVTV